jgi:hypothetical protein
MRGRDTNAPDATSLALASLSWTLNEPSRADRLLALTGLDATDLRARAAEPELLAAVLGFLMAHERDLTACAESLGVEPAALVAAHAELEA